ncbi:glycosyltransferase family 4 protein [Mucilaginibacter sp. Mucisp86]|uniref:glycosyltransferase family 4 protein n=1 Tax=Mucilaginibacter sp. Mucisp86 TaxID=3243060 RepID=UPI0039B6553E
MVIINARFLTQKITGVQRFAIEICRALKKLNPDVIFVCPHNILNKELAAELDAVVIGKRTGNIWEQVDLRNYLIANNKPVLINLCNTGLLFYRNQIVTIHDMSYKVNPSWFSKKFYYWYNFLIPHIANNSLKILTVSNSSKDDIIKFLRLPAHKIKVIYNATSMNIPENQDPFPVQDKYLLTISSLDPRKNLTNLITAFNDLDSNVKLVIVGLKSDNFAAAFDSKLINEKVIIKGYVSDRDLANLIKHAEAFIYISLYEGFGLPPLEAMQLECPVILSNIPVHKEIYNDSALYADPNNVKDIRNKITNLLGDDNLKKQLILKGNNNIKRFSWDNSAKELLSIINELV